MNCPKCNSDNTCVKGSRSPSTARSHIPRSVRMMISRGKYPQNWFVRCRDCRACSHRWWTIEICIPDYIPNKESA